MSNGYYVPLVIHLPTIQPVIHLKAAKLQADIEINHTMKRILGAQT